MVGGWPAHKRAFPCKPVITALNVSGLAGAYAPQSAPVTMTTGDAPLGDKSQGNPAPQLERHSSGCLHSSAGLVENSRRIQQHQLGAGHARSWGKAVRVAPLSGPASAACVFKAPPMVGALAAQHRVALPLPSLHTMHTSIQSGQKLRRVQVPFTKPGCACRCCRDGHSWRRRNREWQNSEVGLGQDLQFEARYRPHSLYQQGLLMAC